MRRCHISLVCAWFFAAPVRAQVVDPPELSAGGVEQGCVVAVSPASVPPPERGELAAALATGRAASTPALGSAERDPAAQGAAPERPARHTVSPAPLPAAPAVADLARGRCLSVLRERGVRFQQLDPGAARGVGIPIRVEGLVGGIRVASRGHSELHEIMDCRLVVALLLWAPELSRAGVRGLLHYSTYRPGARVAQTGRRSGHARALAIDLAVVVMEDGTEHEILTDWRSRARGADPCAARSEGPPGARLRGLVCGAASSGLFQIILTPHYDAAHANHVHLELRPGVRWQYVH